MSKYRDYRFRLPADMGELIFVPGNGFEDMKRGDLDDYLMRFGSYIEDHTPRRFYGLRDVLIGNERQDMYQRRWQNNISPYGPPISREILERAVNTIYSQGTLDEHMGELKKLEAPVVEVKPLDKAGLESVKNLFAAEAKVNRLKLARNRANDAYDKACRDKANAGEAVKGIFGSNERKKVVKLNEKEVGIVEKMGSGDLIFSVEKLEKVGR